MASFFVLFFSFSSWLLWYSEQQANSKANQNRTLLWYLAIHSVEHATESKQWTMIFFLSSLLLNVRVRVFFSMAGSTSLSSVCFSSLYCCSEVKYSDSKNERPHHSQRLHLHTCVKFELRILVLQAFVDQREKEIHECGIGLRSTIEIRMDDNGEYDASLSI